MIITNYFHAENYVTCDDCKDEFNGLPDEIINRSDELALKVEEFCELVGRIQNT